MTSFGILNTPTEYSMPPTNLGRWAEANGFESIWFSRTFAHPNQSPNPISQRGRTARNLQRVFRPVCWAHCCCSRNQQAQTWKPAFAWSRSTM